MKTWEMIAMLEKNPKLRFTDNSLVGADYLANVVGMYNNRLSWIRPNGEVFNDFPVTIKNMNLDWELVREPVPVWEAIKAFVMEGKNISCVADGSEVKFTIKCNADYKHAFSNVFILTGTWYIEEGE